MTVFDIPEAQGVTFLDGTPLTTDSSNPTSTSEKRPIFQWPTIPVPAGAPSGAKVKFLLDIALYSKSLGNIDQVLYQNTDKLYDRDFFITPVDCSPPDADHVCRLHLNTVVVDDKDRFLGWAPDHDVFYAVQ